MALSLRSFEVDLRCDTGSNPVLIEFGYDIYQKRHRDAILTRVSPTKVNVEVSALLWIKLTLA